MTGSRVDLLGDELVRVEREKTPTDMSLHDATATSLDEQPRIHGPCHVCKAKQAQERCLHCEGVVCREHYWVMLGLCKKCATEEEFQAAQDGGPRIRPDLDIKWVDE